MELVVYADGSIIGNGQKNNVGAWSALVMSAGRDRILVGHDFDTTNNRMEMQAVIEGIRFTRSRAKITVYSDSEYVIKGFTEGRADKWAARNWTRKIKKNGYGPRNAEIPNADLWRILNDLDLRHEIEWVHIKGHQTKAQLMEDTHAERQQVCHDWASSEAVLAREVRDKGLMGMPFPGLLEERTELITQIKKLMIPPDPPYVPKQECWAVMRRLKPKLDSALDDEVFFIPISPSEYTDGGKEVCEKAAEVMNNTDDTKDMGRFRTKYVPRYVARRVKGEEVKDGTAAA